MKNNYILRNLEKQIQNWLFKDMVIILYGARRVGKTTMVKHIIEDFGDDAIYFNCDLAEVRKALESQDHITIKNYIGEKKLVVFDEAQQVRDIGLSLKILHDEFPDLQIIATGSSSFDLANKVGEPLTGRSISFKLYPFSISELEAIYNRFEILSQIDPFLIYGMYPTSVLSNTVDKTVFLKNLVENYLYKDILAFENLKRPDLLLDLLRALALQVGAEVSVNELGTRLGCGTKTVVRYLDLLEKNFVIFKLKPLSRNLRNEIGKKFKVFFYDLGIRNALIERFVSLDKRDDIGALWENFCILERIKYNQKNEIGCNIYFWRNHKKKEVDYIEEKNGEISAFEFKWRSEKYKAPEDFLEAYDVDRINLVNRDNFVNFVF
ncbi:ATP-binding protein [Patescibacteria group bacterium]|nr:ATP-binding protein [Patescibacteria group bacterium]